jgi:RNA polymerase sigma-70 factor (sigma-E family)
MDVSSKDDDFSRFFAAESERLRRLGIFLTADPHRATELAQEALARTYRHWGRIQGDDPAAYARRILINLVRSQHRRDVLRRRHEEREPAEPTEEANGRIDDWLRITEALKLLPHARRAAIVLRFYEDMSEKDIARVLDRPLGTVKSDLHRGLRSLRRVLEGSEREPV